MEHSQLINDDKERLISLAEAAGKYGLTQRYLSKLAKKGRLQAQKYGPIWLTTPKDVEIYIASRQKRGVYREDIDVTNF
ncbi:MAG: hypothetical protein ACPG8W_00090 [Candidatus Promineifilaceae bacterium]